MTRIGSLSIGVTGWVALGVSLAALSPSAAQAACAQWNVSGFWLLTQSNGANVELELQQNGNVITGSAKWREIIDNGILVSDEKYHYGSVDGTVQGNSFNVQMYWTTDRTVGVYTGEIGPQGRIEGRTYERSRPANQASWFSGATMNCAAQESAQATQPKPIRKLGKKKAANPNDATVLQGAGPDAVLVQPAQSAIGSAAILQQPDAVSQPVVKQSGAVLKSTQQATLGFATGFSGTWDTVTAAGNHFLMTLQQNGNRVTGSYSPANGTIDGTIGADGRLVYRWTENGNSIGTGIFALAADGRSFQGSYSTSDDPNLVSSVWNGARTK